MDPETKLGRSFSVWLLSAELLLSYNTKSWSVMICGWSKSSVESSSDTYSEPYLNLF